MPLCTPDPRGLVRPLPDAAVGGFGFAFFIDVVAGVSGESAGAAGSHKPGAYILAVRGAAGDGAAVDVCVGARPEKNTRIRGRFTDSPHSCSHRERVAIFIAIKNGRGRPRRCAFTPRRA